MRVLSVSQRFLALNTFVKQERITTKSFIERILRKVSRMTSMKMVVILVIFGANGATVLAITSERIELEGCACAQVEAFEEWNGLLYQDDAWDLSERGRNASKTP